MILGLKGGGPIELRSQSQIRSGERGGSMRDMSDFEADNFDAALSFLMNRLIEQDAQVKNCDITRFLDLETCVIDGLLSAKGDFEILREVHLFKQTGIEKTLAFSRWMIAVHCSLQ